MVHVLAGEYLHTFFGILPQGNLSILSPFIYLFNCLFVSVWPMNLHFGYKLIKLYFITEIVLALAIGISFSWLLFSFDITSSLWVVLVWFCFWAYPNLLTLQGTPSSSCIFCASFLESAISPRGSSSFSWRMVLIRNKDMELGMLIAAGV